MHATLQLDHAHSFRRSIEGLASEWLNSIWAQDGSAKPVPERFSQELDPRQPARCGADEMSLQWAVLRKIELPAGGDCFCTAAIQNGSGCSEGLK